jgi:putative two-component system response regulator
MRAQYRFIAEISNTVIDQALDLKHYNARLEEKVRERTRELHEAHLEAIYMLAVASEAKDEDTGHHVRRIQKYAHALARKLGIAELEAEAIGYAAILHDVGKFHVPDAILQKPGPLTPDERAEMQQHTVSGERIIADSVFFTRARQIARSHHENWDGSGYPDGRSGAAIPFEARIVHVVDVYDALTSKRSYKAAWTSQQAIEELKRGTGRMFEAELVNALEAMLAEQTVPVRELVTA